MVKKWKFPKNEFSFRNKLEKWLTKLRIKLMKKVKHGRIEKKKKGDEKMNK